ncbi:MAG: DEAD/DEAH box helicase [Verrucomicrobia bacterium]|nr:DEAD/DEAH box helicase [Verrucomicrobiota bacterium]MCH8526071.1 DEAD/DEAH box helicase [Kiritimatiellia bacterium]
MPAKIFQKVRTLLKPKGDAAAPAAPVKSESAAAPAPAPAPAPTPAPVAGAVKTPARAKAAPAAAPAAAPESAREAAKESAREAAKESPKKASSRKGSTDQASAGPLPEALRQIKEVRAGGAQEEWRPTRRRQPARAAQSDGESAPRRAAASADTPEGERPARRRRTRKPRSEDAPAAAAPEGTGGNGEDRGSTESKRPRRTRRPSSEQQTDGDAKPERAGRDRSERSDRGGNRGKQAKGFSFPRPKEAHGDWSRESYAVPEAEGKTRFTDLDLADELLHAVSDLGYKYATPIQAGILPALLNGQDGLGQAQTGTGKTAAFLLASFTRMLRNPRPDSKNGSPRILIIAPTRELVLQIEEEAAILGKYTPFQTLPVYGGLDFEAQMDALRNNVVDLVVATPGRLIDFLRKKVINLSDVETLVLDEADRMLDMGFIPDVKRIVYATPHKDKRQTLFFSATFTDDVRRLAESWTRNPVSVVIEPENVAADTVDQTVYIITDEQKFPLTVNLLRKLQPARCLIFANRRDSSQYLCDRLRDYEFSSALLTGAVPQAKRVKTLEDFKSGAVPILVATDVAGRGIHVEDVSLVINFNLPEDAEDYVHRIGRTGRAGAEGRSICFADEMDSMLIPDIETYLGRPLVCTHPEEEWLTIEERERTHHKARSRERAEGGGGGRGGSRGGGGGRGGPRGGGGRGGPRGGGGRGRR